ncbi:adenosine receptor A2b, partial [Agrilus planipennis]|uniref:Adenosine receptor A2b n=1 Tax=Agrilus planipennis TaxID=224129 RepID=A0A1W4XRR8_AGRPL
MEISLINYTHQALVLYTVETEPTTNTSSYDFNVTRSLSKLSTPWAVTVALLLVFVISPMIVIGNSLILVAICRFKRLRTPSNYLVTSLAVSDLGVGTFMPVGTYLESGSYQEINVHTCLVSYSVVITLCCVSVLVMVAIAVDRFTSLAKPLRYQNLITHTAVERYIFVFWIYSAIVGFSPLGYVLVYGAVNGTSVGKCSFGAIVARPVQLFMFCAVYGPSALVLLTCYGYVYVVARGHAR